MWSDNQTSTDFLNFRCVADTVVEMIIQAEGQPLSMGVSGGWGAGKSSMLELISDSLEERGNDRYLFVKFNAWLYQGYDDARAALIEVIANKLFENKDPDKLSAKAKKFFKKVNWVRAVGLTAGAAVSWVTGLPVGAVGAVLQAGRNLYDGKVEKGEAKAIESAEKAIAAEPGKLLSPDEESPPQQIHDLRKEFKELLLEMDVTLVVFIDDLDRCLPPTTIATLEAIRLFLFIPQTAFIIAADDQMIRQAVRAHFDIPDLDDKLVTSYFDKLIQVPLRVPPLGTQEVRAYLMLLYVEKSKLDAEQKETIRKRVCEQLSQSWKGKRVDRRFMLELVTNCSDDLRANFELADRLAPLMTTAKEIGGNPRLIKRFLNTLSIRLSIGRSQDINPDESALAKMLLFERCATKEAYSALIAAINDGVEGKPDFLADWEKQARSGEKIESKAPWDSPFIANWLALSPSFADMDLRKVVYVSREHMPIITSADQLSSDAAGILEALLTLDERPSSTLSSQVTSLPGRDVTLMTNRVMVRARQQQEWGTPPALWAMLTIIEGDSEQSQIFSRFLRSVPASQIQPDIIPVLGDFEWAENIFSAWLQNSKISKPVRKAIKALSKGR